MKIIIHVQKYQLDYLTSCAAIEKMSKNEFMQGVIAEYLQDRPLLRAGRLGKKLAVLPTNQQGELLSFVFPPLVLGRLDIAVELLRDEGLFNKGQGRTTLLWNVFAWWLMCEGLMKPEYAVKKRVETMARTKDFNLPEKTKVQVYAPIVYLDYLKEVARLNNKNLYEIYDDVVSIFLKIRPYLKQEGIIDSPLPLLTPNTTDEGWKPVNVELTKEVMAKVVNEIDFLNANRLAGTKVTKAAFIYNCLDFGVNYYYGRG